jgi:antitoxin component HigA of HigAB toxin-antitoxin module
MGNKEAGAMYEVSDAMDEYPKLVRAFPLVSIRDDRHLDEAIKVLHRLLDLPERFEGQEMYLGALGDRIEAYETVHADIPKASCLEVLTHLMEASDLKQKDMDFVFGNKAVTSAMLSGARPIGLTHARQLSERFALPINVFLTTR